MFNFLFYFKSLIYFCFFFIVNNNQRYSKKKYIKQIFSTVSEGCVGAKVQGQDLGLKAGIWALRLGPESEEGMEKKEEEKGESIGH